MADAGQLALADHVVKRLERQVRVDRPCAVADEQGEMVYLARLAALQHEADLRPRPGADQVMVRAGDDQ